jgi:hypothetical protein
MTTNSREHKAVDLPHHLRIQNYRDVINRMTLLEIVSEDTAEDIHARIDSLEVQGGGDTRAG